MTGDKLIVLKKNGNTDQKKNLNVRVWCTSIIASLVFATITVFLIGERLKTTSLKLEIVKLNTIIKIQEKDIVDKTSKLTKFRKVESKEIVSKYIRKVNPKVFELLSDLLATKFIECSSDFEFPIGVVVALAQIESTFKYDSVSDKGAIGIMQINPEVWEETLIKEGIITCKYDLYDPSKNIISGTYVLKHYFDQCETNNKMEYAITRYLGGTENGHFSKVMKACGKYYLFIKEEK